MTLCRCVSRCTLEPLSAEGPDEVFVPDAVGQLDTAPPAFAARVSAHLARLREWSGTTAVFRVGTTNSFPTGAGLASSASGFAALATAFCAAIGRTTTAEELSRLARLSGSGSAARSVVGGYVEWPGDAADLESPARQLAPPEHWDLRDVVVVVDRTPKEVSSREGHRRASTSPYLKERLARLPDRLQRTRRALAERDFAALGEVVEEEAIDLHLIAMSSRPPIFYWAPATVAVLARVRELRDAGLPVCFTIDAGANVHALTPAAGANELTAELARLPGVEEVIADGVGGPPRLVEEHLL